MYKLLPCCTVNDKHDLSHTGVTVKIDRQLKECEIISNSIANLRIFIWLEYVCLGVCVF